MRLSSVLIETSWNVNEKEKSTEQKFAERINRNIVECKWEVKALVSHVRSCINRNIVECKLFINVVSSRTVCVLIETSWNVNWLGDSG